MSLTIRREVDLSDHTVLFVVDSEIGRRYEIHCDRCGEHDVLETQDDVNAHGLLCAHCDRCEACEGTGEVSSDWFYGDDSTGLDADIACPACNGTGRPS